MERKAVSGIMLTLVLLSVSTLAFNIQPAKASEIIYIGYDGTIDPPTAPIQRDEDNYSFTDNIYDEILVEKSNIIVDGNGYTLQGSGSGSGFTLMGINNVTIQNTNIKNFNYGVSLFSSSFDTVSGNNITNNYYCGIWLELSSNNDIYHNNFIDNTEQVYFSDSYYSTNVWDDGYPSGGNYWSDYGDRYPDAEELDGSSIWDTPYVIDADNQDNYPLMNPWAPLIPRITGVSGSPAAPSYDEEVTVTATIKDNVAVDEALLSYTCDSTWHNVSMSRFDDLFNATIPAQPYGILVEYMIYANDTDGNLAVSDIHSYTVIDDVPPEIHFVRCTPLLNILANVTEPTSASGVDRTLLCLKLDDGNWWKTTLTYDSTLGLWTRTIFGYNQLAGETIGYFIETYDKAGNKQTGEVLSHSVEEWRVADLNRDGKVNRVDILILITCLRGALLIGFAGLLMGSVVYVKRRKKKQQD